MTCKDAERLIPIFIGGELNYHDLEQFVDHIEGCPNCKEEMSIQYLIAEGMVRLEDGAAFDLGRELESLLEVSKSRVRVHKALQYLGIGLELAALITIITVILIILL